MSDALLEYACGRISELESLLLVEVPETVWPAEVALVYSQVESAGNLLHPDPLATSASSAEGGVINQ